MDIDQNKSYVYLHLNPLSKQIFYVGKGKGNRCLDFKSRSDIWKKYCSGFKGDPYVIIVQDELSQDFASKLETKLIIKLGSFLVGGSLVNIDRSGIHPDSIIKLGIDHSNLYCESKYKEWSDQAIVKDVLSFPNEKLGDKMLEAFMNADNTIGELYSDLEDLNDDLAYDLMDIVEGFEDTIIDLTYGFIDKSRFVEIMVENLHKLDEFEESEEIVPLAKKLINIYRNEVRAYLKMSGYIKEDSRNT